MNPTLHILLIFTLASPITSDINLEVVPGGLSGTAVTTRYWDCCKPSCAWADLVTQAPSPVTSCSADGYTAAQPSEDSGCDEDGTSFMCSSHHGYAVNTSFAYGFAAASFRGGADFSKCCSCMLLTFRDQIPGKQMVVQVTNTGSDLVENHFDIAIPGGGLGLYQNGCQSQWGYFGGDQGGSVETAEGCETMPEPLRPGCLFRFDWMEGAGNPNVEFVEVGCPEEVVGLSGCRVG